MTGISKEASCEMRRRYIRVMHKNLQDGILKRCMGSRNDKGRSFDEILRSRPRAAREKLVWSRGTAVVGETHFT